MQINDFGNKNRVLTSWKEIASYLGKGVRTVQRWEKDFGLPVRRPVHSDKSAILARTSDLDAWIAMRCSTRSRDDGAASQNHQLLAARSSLVAALTTARMLHDNHATLVSEVQAALAGLHREIRRMQQDAETRSPAPVAEVPQDSALLPNTTRTTEAA